MTNSNGDRKGRIEALLERSIIASDERLTRIENLVESNHLESNERMTRIESGSERLEQVVISNNRFLESFSTDIRRYVDTMNNFAARLDGIIATSNQDRLEANTRLAAIGRQVAAMPGTAGGAIAKHLEVGNQ